jgi:lipopolysaccharide/colanic/teichoic acid biosynthesis glycosyltransferase
MRGESVAVAPPPAAAWHAPVRRAFDIVMAAAALIVLAVPMLVIAAAIRLDSPGPALFRQRRVGRDRRPFTLLKFRTMRVGTTDAALRELIARELAGEDASTNGSWKLAVDDRVTRLGAVLRRTSLDELPQLLNVLAGSMSIVGPRPCLAWEAEMFPPEYHARFDVKPGLTGLWQVSGRSTMGTLEMLELDVEYVRTRTPRGDLAIVARTVPALLGRNGAR